MYLITGIYESHATSPCHPAVFFFYLQFPNCRQNQWRTCTDDSGVTVTHTLSTEPVIVACADLVLVQLLCSHLKSVL